MSNTATKTYAFVLVGSPGFGAFTEAELDALFEAGCDDATPIVIGGAPRLEFDREADSREAAIRSAVRNVTASCPRFGLIHIEDDAGQIFVA